MKTVLAIVMTFILTCGAYAQGCFNGNTSAGGRSAKCTEFDGTYYLVLGPQYYGQWFVGPANCSERELAAAGPTKNFAGGYCQAGAITTPFAPGSTITVQFRAWRGANSWDEADARRFDPSWGGDLRESPLYQVSGLVTGTALPPTVSINGFVFYIPEPSTIALSVLGLSVLLLRRNK